MMGVVCGPQLTRYCRLDLRHKKDGGGRQDGGGIYLWTFFFFLLRRFGTTKMHEFLKDQMQTEKDGQARATLP